jgi:type IV secretion system protein VirB9
VISDKKTQLREIQNQLMSQQSPEIRAAMKNYAKLGKAPIIRNPQFLQYPFDESQPIIQCQPLRACDIELEEGELITGQIHVGDSSRWLYSESFSGTGTQKKIHVIVKPTEDNISTNMIITTNRRTYYLGLLSKPGNYVRRVKFYYPRDLQQMSTVSHRQKLSREISALPHIDITKVDNHYEIKTVHAWFNPDPTWVPKNVFNDGKGHVFMQMPPDFDQHDLPALFVVKHDGTQALVNYRIRDGWYVIDDLFQQAVLLSGTGKKQQQVIIRYLGDAVSK